MSSLITRVRAKLFIPSRMKSVHALDGAYASLMRGRGDDFEDLREYQQGDEVRDIDWRATARRSTPMVKRMRANRMHTVLFVVDTGRGMGALAADERPKRELAVIALGLLGLLTLRHDDDIAVVTGDASRVRRTPPRRSEGALEAALREIDAGGAPDGPPSARERLLDHVVRTVSRRMIVVVVTDEAPVTDETERLLRRLRAQHDVLWLTLADADPVLARPGVSARRDVDTGWQVPAFLHGDAAVTQELEQQRRAETERRAELMTALEVTHAELRTQDRAVADLLRMLTRRAHVGA